MKRPLRVLVVEESVDFAARLASALGRDPAACQASTVHSDREMTDYLRQHGKYSAPVNAPRPDVILLDWKISGNRGARILEDLKKDRTWRTVPVVVLVAGRHTAEVAQSYQHGGASTIVRPVTSPAMEAVTDAFVRYWSDVVRLPGSGHTSYVR